MITKRKLAVLLMACMLGSLFSVGTLAAEEAEGSYMFGDSPILVDAGIFFTYSFYDWTPVLDGFEPTLNALERRTLSDFLGALGLMTSLRIGANAAGLHPVLSAGIMDIYAGGELSLGFGLGVDVGLRGLGRLSLTPTDNEGNPGDTIYVQPFVGLLGLFPDFPGALKDDMEDGQKDPSELDDSSGIGFYFDLGVRFGYVLANGLGAYVDIQYPLGNMSPLRFTFGSSYSFNL